MLSGGFFVPYYDIDGAGSEGQGVLLARMPKKGLTRSLDG